MVLAMLMSVQVLVAQHFPRVKAILENPDLEYTMVIDNTVQSLQSIAETIQPKKSKRALQRDEATLEMSFRVFQRAAVGSRPFGKIRYKIYLRKTGEDVTCTFGDFDFKKYERSARYGRMMEVKGKGQEIPELEGILNEIQWGTVRWRMDDEVNKYQNRLLAFESRKDIPITVGQKEQ